MKTRNIVTIVGILVMMTLIVDASVYLTDISVITDNSGNTYIINCDSENCSNLVNYTFTSADVDNLCGTNDKVLMRVDGNWTCGDENSPYLDYSNGFLSFDEDLLNTTIKAFDTNESARIASLIADVGAINATVVINTANIANINLTLKNDIDSVNGSIISYVGLNGTTIMGSNIYSDIAYLQNFFTNDTDSGTGDNNYTETSEFKKVGSTVTLYLNRTGALPQLTASFTDSTTGLVGVNGSIISGGYSYLNLSYLNGFYPTLDDFNDVNLSVTSNINDITNVNSSLTQLQSDVTNMNLTITTNIADIIAINSTVTLNTNDITNINLSVTSNTNDITNINVTVTTNYNNIADVNSTLNGLITTNINDIADINATIAQNTGDIANVNQTLASDISNVNDTLDGKINDVNSTLTSDINAINASIVVLDADGNYIDIIGTTITFNETRAELQYNQTDLVSTLRTDVESNETYFDGLISALRGDVDANESYFDNLISALQTFDTNIRTNVTTNQDDISTNSGLISNNAGEIVKINDTTNAINSSYWVQDGTDLYYNDGDVGIGTTEPNTRLDVEDNDSGLVGINIKNNYNEQSVLSGSILTIENGAGALSITGMTGNDTTFLGGIYDNTFQNYQNGYGDTLFAIAGDKDFAWYSDPTNQHDYVTVMANEIMRLDSLGNLDVSENVTSKYVIADGSLLRNVNETDVASLHLNQDNWGNSTDGYIQWNSATSKPIFNESKFEIKYYNVTESQTVAGTVVGSIDVIAHPDGNYDGQTLNITETAGSPGLDVRMNYTDVVDFSQGLIRYYTSTLAGDYPVIQMWDYEDGDWEDYPSLAETLTFNTVTQPIFDADSHIENGIVQMRLYKAANGNINNKYYLDWVSIAKGFGVPSGEEIDPYALHRDGTVPLTANMDVGNFNITLWQINAQNWDNVTITESQINDFGTYATSTELSTLETKVDANNVSQNLRITQNENDIANVNSTLNGLITTNINDIANINLTLKNDIDAVNASAADTNDTLQLSRNWTYIQNLNIKVDANNISQNLRITQNENDITAINATIQADTNDTVQLARNWTYIQNLKTEVNNVRVNVTSNKLFITNVRTNVSNLQTFTVNLRTNISSNQLSISNLETFTGNLRTNISTNQGAITNLNTYVDNVRLNVSFNSLFITNVRTNLSTEINLQKTNNDTQEIHINKNAADIVDVNASIQVDTNDTIQLAKNWTYTQALKTEVNNVRANVTTNAGDISTNTGSISNNKDEIDAIRVNVTSNDGDITTNANDISNNKNEIDAIRANVTSNDDDISVLQTFDTNLRANVTSNQNDITQLESDISDVNSTLQTQITTNINDIANVNTTLKNDIDAVNATIPIDTNETVRVEQLISDVTDINSSVETNTNDITDINTTLKSDIDDVNDSIVPFVYAEYHDQYVNTTSAVTFSSAQLTSALTVANGGTGTQTLTDGAFLWGAGTSEIEESAQVPNGVIAIGIAEGTNPALVGAFTAYNGFVKHEFGGLEANVASYTNGLYGQIAGSTADVDTSAEIITAISDETGTGLLVFNTAPTFTGLITAQNLTISSVNTTRIWNTTDWISPALIGHGSADTNDTIQLARNWTYIQNLNTKVDANNVSQNTRITQNENDITNINLTVTSNTNDITDVNSTLITLITTNINDIANINLTLKNDIDAVNASGGSTYLAGNGMSLSVDTFSVAGNTALTQDADGLSVTDNAIGDTQLTYNTGQHLTDNSDVEFTNLNIKMNLTVAGNLSIGGSTFIVNEENNSVNIGAIQSGETLYVKSTVNERDIALFEDDDGREVLRIGSNSDVQIRDDSGVPGTVFFHAEGSTGFVGIGTTTPTQKLQIVGNITATSYCNETLCQPLEDWSESVLIDTSNMGGWTNTSTVTTTQGKVGIGKTNPTEELEIYENTTANNILKLDNPNNAVGATTQIQVISNAYTGRLIATSDGYTYHEYEGFTFVGDAPKLTLMNKHASGVMQFIVGGDNTADIAMKIENDGDAWFVGDVSALSFTDRTERSDLTTEELKTDIKLIDDSNDICIDGSCEIDKSTYPEEWIKETVTCDEYEKIQEFDIETAKMVETEGICIKETTTLARDLTITVSDLIRIIKEQQFTIDDLYNRVELLENPISEISK